MWSIRTEELTNYSGIKFHVELDGKAATFSDVLQGWLDDPAFCSKFNTWLADCPFSAFRWETPCVTTDTVSQAFEFVLLDSPYLSRPPDSLAFADHFEQSPAKDILVFPNLGGDGIMIVPNYTAQESVYGHLAEFVRGAPELQQQMLWKTVAEAMYQRLSAKPVWLSTHGGGVSWLHVRLDDRPKYYGYGPYRRID